MAISLKWLGHGGWAIRTGQHSILVDPFLTENPTAPMSIDELQADTILVSHGHFDHIADVPAIAQRTKAQVVSSFEIAQWLGRTHGLQNTLGMNLGGSARFPFGTIKMTQAWHSSALPDGSYGGNPAGFLLRFERLSVYFACDTALFSDMRLYAAPRLDLAVLPIGDLFTMGPEDAVEAVKLLQPRYVLPAHYNTWPPIEQDAVLWADRVRAQTTAIPKVLNPGESFELQEATTA
jgi:L-ascorbate metabolism protein UlaG (beta-lactamase superfamily)